MYVKNILIYIFSINECYLATLTLNKDLLYLLIKTSANFSVNYFSKKL